MKVIVVGNVIFTLEMLQVIYQQDVEIVGVVTGDRSLENSDYVDIQPFCKNNAIPCYQTNDINSSESVRWIESKQADIIFCLGWSRLIKSQVLNLTPMGVIGYHPSLLPENRGRHPLIWALVLGLKETGSTFFFMDEGADSGDIVSQERVKISILDNAETLYTKVIKIAKQQLITTVQLLISGEYYREHQDHELANSWRKREERDGEIDWRMSAQSIHNLIRGLTHPYVGAHFIVLGDKYKVFNSCIMVMKEVDNIEPGKVISCDTEGLIVKCGEGCIKLLNISPKPKLSVGDYL